MANRELLQRAGLEMTAIVFSVLFALFLNDMWQDHRTEVSHQQTLALLKAELIANREDILEAKDYYQAIAPKIGAVLQDGVTPAEVTSVQEESLQLKSAGGARTAHEIAIMTGLYSWLDPATAAALIDPFVAHDQISQVSDAMAQSAINSAVDDPEEFYKRYYVMALSLAPSLEELLELTDLAIKTIEEMDGMA